MSLPPDYAKSPGINRLSRGQSQRPTQCSTPDREFQTLLIPMQVGTPARLDLGRVDHRPRRPPHDPQQVLLGRPLPTSDAGAYGNSDGLHGLRATAMSRVIDWSTRWTNRR